MPFKIRGICFGEKLVGVFEEGQGRNSSAVSKESFNEGEGGSMCFSFKAVPPLPYTDIIYLMRVLFDHFWGY